MGLLCGKGFKLLLTHFPQVIITFQTVWTQIRLTDLGSDLDPNCLTL